MDRSVFVALLNEWLVSQSMIEHSVAVEHVLRRYAKIKGEDEDLWAATGLLHDLDFEKFPETNKHGLKTAEILQSLNVNQTMIDAILSHNLNLGFARNSDLARCLLASDELVGLIVACAKVLPDKNINKLKVSSVLKKFKSPSFAKSIDRDEIMLGVKEFGVDLEEHIMFIISALAEIAPSIGINNSTYEG